MTLRLQIEMQEGMLGALADMVEREKLESVGDAAKLLISEGLVARDYGPMPAPRETRDRDRRGSGFAGYPKRAKAGG